MYNYNQTIRQLRGRFSEPRVFSIFCAKSERLSRLKFACCLIIINLTTLNAFSQNNLKGYVQDSRNNPIFAATILLKHNPEQTTSTDLDGKFVLQSKNLDNDTLEVSYLGYKTLQIALSKIPNKDSILLVLQGRGNHLSEIIITARTPISADFSAVQLTKLDVYLNPAAQGDPLKAISFLPSSTTNDESANPSFRGSSIDRTRVILNCVPIYQPIRNAQINKVGNFSIFSPEIINKEYAYASNPPLTYGNTSSGLVDITTLNELPHNQLQFTAAVSSLDVFLSQKIESNSFVQIFGNYQFSGPFISLNQSNLHSLKSFETQDIALNYHLKASKRLEINSFNYFINEGYQANMESYTYAGLSISARKRFFSVNNLFYYTNNGVLGVHIGFDRETKNFEFGNIVSDKQSKLNYASINYKYIASSRCTLETGFSNDNQKVAFDDILPSFYYAQSPKSPAYPLASTIKNRNLEAYLYSIWEVGSRWNFFSGIRSNIPNHGQTPYLSGQVGIKYETNHHQSLSLNLGHYNSYSVPDYYQEQFNLLKSDQISLEYHYKRHSTLLTLATFYTRETGQEATEGIFNSQGVNILGAEFMLEQHLHKYVKLTFANAYINKQKMVYGKSFASDKSLNYFVKTSITYQNPKLFSTSLTYIGRPGTYYTPVLSAYYDSLTQFYRPVYNEQLYSNQLGNYNRFDISLSRYISLNKASLICFFSVNNIFNTKNESNIIYSQNYTQSSPDYYQRRIWFFGIVWGLKY